jgi:hypothetical protein
MTYVRLNGKDFKLPWEQMYIKNFQNCIKSGVLDFEGLDTETKYKYVDKLFDAIVKMFTISLGTLAIDNPEYRFAGEIKKICDRIDPVDHSQKFVYSDGRPEKAIELMTNFLEDLLTLKEYMDEEEKKEIVEPTFGGR